MFNPARVLSSGLAWSLYKYAHCRVLSMEPRQLKNSPFAGWPGRYIHVWQYGGLSVVHLQLKVTLESFVKRREFIPANLSC